MKPPVYWERTRVINETLGLRLYKGIARFELVFGVVVAVNFKVKAWLVTVDDFWPDSLGDALQIEER